MANPTGKGGFQKGKDPRRNTKGRPKSFDALRALAQSIASEPDDIVISWTRIEGILRDWAKSQDASLQRAFVEIAYGKVPQPIEGDVSGKFKIEVEYLSDWQNEADQIAHATFRTKDDSDAPSALQIRERGETLEKIYDGTASGS